MSFSVMVQRRAESLTRSSTPGLHATNAEQSVIEGAIRVAAIEKKRFEITDFVTRADCLAPRSSHAHFPPALVEKIHTKAGVKK